MLTNLDIAEIWDGVGEPTRAAQYRALHADETADLPDVRDLIAEIGGRIDDVQPSKAHSGLHEGEKWRTCAACLADEIGGMLA